MPTRGTQPKSVNQTLKGLPATSHIQRRTANNVAAATLEIPRQIASQHWVLCQTYLPYRDPGPDVRVWEKESWFVSLSLEAGSIKNPETRKWVPLGLPFGPKPRLILSHLNAEALKSGSTKIDVEDSFTAFVQRIQKRTPTGPEIAVYKDQLSRIATVIIRMAMVKDGHAFQFDSEVITAFELPIESDEQQCILWPLSIRLSHEYFTSLQNHAVPLDERALSGLAHSAMALDIYAWLAQRLHRVPRGKPQFIAWAALEDQFGAGYKPDLALALSHYPSAKVEGDSHGLTLYSSPPPVKKRMVLAHKP